MAKVNYQVFETNNRPIKAWVRGVPMDAKAKAQLENIAALPFIHKRVAVMPDVHRGKGATVGSVIATKRAIIPAAVGVDIGCGMIAVRTTLTASDLPDNLAGVRSDIERAVPHGRTANGGRGDRGAWQHVPREVAEAWARLAPRFAAITDKHPKVKQANTAQHLGTLGTGNHFIELCLDESERVWVMLHSGSRGVGNRIGSYFIELAKQEMRRFHVNLPDQNLAYLPEGSRYFDDYVEAVGWAQDFAMENRRLMMQQVFAALRNLDCLPAFSSECMAVNCHHNYVARESHFGETVFVTRKGAVRAREGDLGIIPGSMGARSYIVRG